MRKQHRELARAIAAQGLRVVSVQQTPRGHMRFCITNGEREYEYVAAGTASDYRALRNAIADIVREFKEKT